MLKTQHPVAPLAPVIDAETAIASTYDAVIVGAGVSGSILAHELTQKGFRVLIVEAGLGQDLNQHGLEHYLETFYSVPYKDNNAPFPRNPNAEMPRSSDLRKLPTGETNTEAYWVQTGPYVSDSVYSRVLGGTTVHWEAKAIRMLREDFELKTQYGQGLNWPSNLRLDQLMPYYEKAEFVLGVSGDVASQKKLGVEYSSPDYVYPMFELKPSYLDQVVASRSEGMHEYVEGEKFNIDWVTFPQAKNADPNPAYAKWNGGRSFQPVGALSTHQDQEGERCQGNTNCVPLCPVQARFDARKLLVKALKTGRADLLSQAVASQVHIDPVTREVTGIDIKHYKNRHSSEYRSLHVRGKLFILAANAVENARLMLASAVLNGQTHTTNRHLGRYLMDHPYLLSWGLLPVKAGTGRGPSCTSGMCSFRRGNFRKKFASFATDIHNDGWGWATGAPLTDLQVAVEGQNLHGRALREALIKSISGQLLLAYMIEMPADVKNGVTVSEDYVDRLGNMKPQVTLNPSDYSLAAAKFARGLSSRIFHQIGAEDYSNYQPSDYGYIEYENEGFAIRGGNHLSGTHVMGDNSSESVVDSNQKSWDHGNLYLIGPGSMPSIGSSNTTLTTAALCYKTAEAVLKHLAALPA